MKATAGGLLVLALAVVVLCLTVGDGHGIWGYLQATAEASLVGGLADWFAVTALFKHPLRLPIPHTAIIPKKKDQIGEGLAGFISEHFLTPEVVGERVAAAHVPVRVGQWLAEPTHARQVAQEISNAVGGMAAVLSDDELRNAVAGIADKRLRELDAAPLLARVIDALCDSGQHQLLLTTALRGTMRLLDTNRNVLRDRLSNESPDWVPMWVDDRVFNRGFTAVQSFLADVSVQDEHELRGTYDTQLRAFAERLRTDIGQAQRINEAKQQLLDHPRVRDWLATLWIKGKTLVVDGAADPDSDLRHTVESLTVRLGEVLRDDLEIGAKVDDALQRLSGHVAEHYAADMAGIISATIERWDADETSRRLELQVGKDLQFIRINGTVVGALAGLVIYTLSRFF